MFHTPINNCENVYIVQNHFMFILYKTDVFFISSKTILSELFYLLTMQLEGQNIRAHSILQRKREKVNRKYTQPARPRRQLSPGFLEDALDEVHSCFLAISFVQLESLCIVSCNHLLLKSRGIITLYLCELVDGYFCALNDSWQLHCGWDSFHALLAYLMLRVTLLNWYMKILAGC
jgi:hypothetical protein